MNHLPKVPVQSKLPHVGTTIFSVMSALAKEHNAINLSQGFPNFDCDDRLKALVYEQMQIGMNQYAPMPGVPALREQLARKIEGLYGTVVDPGEEITITAGATQALFSVITAFVRPGDEVILIEPAYDSYGPAVEVNGGKVVPYELHLPSYHVDWDEFRELITDKTRMILINTPHNPTGAIFSAEDMQQLEQIVADTDILVLSDEVYEHLIFDGKEHQSLLRYPHLYERGMATYSFGKTFHNTGWKVGYCVGPPHLMAEFRKVHQYNVFSVNTPVQYGLAAYLEDPSVYERLSWFYQQKRDYFLELLQGSRLKPIHCAGTYFQTVDYSAISDLPDVEFAEWMTKEAGVASIPVSVFYSSGRDERVVRLCFAKTEEVLREAGKVLRGL
jgi:methionine aminotransferase